MVPHSIRGPSCESMNVVVFAIRHLRQCKICYHIEGHFLLINQSNDCCVSLSLFAKAYLSKKRKKNDAQDYPRGKSKA